jgi:hypothetical protein
MAAMAAMLTAIELCVRRTLRARNEPTAWLTSATTARLLAAIPLTQAIYAIVLVSVFFARNILWRGIRYRVDGPWHIRLVEYRPFQPCAGPVGSTRSL